jgi:1-deoxy-D-xylulose-5-phosphate synthase
MWDLSLLGAVPGLRVAAPRDADRLREELNEAVAVKDGPTVLRFPKASVGGEVAALERRGGVDILRRPSGEEPNDVLLVTVGALAELGMAAADRLSDQGVGVTVVDPRWVKPVPSALVELAAGHSLVVTVEDNGRHGGFGWALAAALRDVDLDVPLRDVGLPQEFHGQGTRAEVLVKLGMTAQQVALRITEWIATRTDATPTPAEMP